jgi:hypothetical protein
MSLVGKFVFISSGPFYKYGKILETTDEHNEFFLVKFFSPGRKSDTISLYNITQMVHVDDAEPQSAQVDDTFEWMFFETEEELNKFVKKIKAPVKKEKKPKGDGKVIQFKR